MYSLLKSLLFLFPAERAHYLAMDLLTTFRKVPLILPMLRGKNPLEKKHLAKTVFGLDFPHPVGLAAGFDKDARWIDALSDLGFAFVEIGTVTPKPQAGNPQPRLFRLKKDRALINRMGFNNQGVEAAVERLKKRNSKVIVGGNIGKNKVTPNEEAVNDYVICFDALFDYVDYFVVNVSSPNTPGLRELQEKGPLLKILNALQVRNRAQKNPKPILLKIAPDLNEDQLNDIVDIVKESGIDGLIAANTTIDRSGLQTSEKEVSNIGNGGLSGAPVKNRSTEVICHLSKRSGGSIPIIGVGGIANARDAQEKLDAGASLVQVYTGFVYEGPSIVSDIVAGLKKN